MNLLFSQFAYFQRQGPWPIFSVARLKIDHGRKRARQRRGDDEKSFESIGAKRGQSRGLGDLACSTTLMECEYILNVHVYLLSECKCRMRVLSIPLRHACAIIRNFQVALVFPTFKYENIVK